MSNNQIVYLKYIKEFNSYSIAKDEIIKLQRNNLVAEIILPPDVSASNDENMPLIGFLLGEDTSKEGKAYYTVSQNYLQTLLNTKARLRFLDYEHPKEQMEKCQGFVLPGGNFDFPEKFFIGGKNLGTGIGKRFLAYETIIKEAYKTSKPMLGICAGAQMIGAVLGKMKMYLYLSKEVPHPCKHKPTEKGEVCMHNLKLIKETPIYEIMNIPQTTEFITINSRHVQAMVLPEVQNQITQHPLVPMTLYAVSSADNIPEIWGNDKAGILCVQGHPEDLATAGNQSMQCLYNYVVLKASHK